MNAVGELLQNPWITLLLSAAIVYIIFCILIGLYWFIILPLLKKFEIIE